jgi:hypothetical protein
VVGPSGMINKRPKPSALLSFIAFVKKSKKSPHYLRYSGVREWRKSTSYEEFAGENLAHAHIKICSVKGIQDHKSRSSTIEIQAVCIELLFGIT